ncbi:MAG TPA: hypothetical protein DCS66_24080 [Flavobacteriaceae bacterium]|nr:hypothetical protein [Flavobacteriaceae bacterium]|tara:strand:- start:1204 stop:1398 length:195 start_codon:yes stop_codon:yes gene_type:complete
MAKEKVISSPLPLEEVDGMLALKPIEALSKVENAKTFIPPQPQPKGKCRGGGAATKGLVFRGVR